MRKKVVSGMVIYHREIYIWNYVVIKNVMLIFEK